jgi:hypothetical protein
MVPLFVVVAVAVALGVARRRRGFDPRKSPVGDALGRTVPAYVVALGAWATGRAPEADLTRARGLALSNEARTALGAETASDVDRLLDAATALARVQERPLPVGTTDPFLSATTSLDQRLAARGLPYFVDADVLVRGAHALPLVVTFYVEREEQRTVDGQAERVVFLWRLDRLNFRDDYLGYTRPRLGAAVVLYDELESDLVRYVLPAVPAGERVELIDDESRDDGAAWQEEVETRAAAILRGDYANAAPAERDAAVRVGKLLARRRELVRKWRRQIAGLGLRLRVPERLVPEADYADELARRIPRSELSEWDELHDDLTSKEGEAAFRLLRDRYAAAVARHELQHRADYRRGLVPVPVPLQRALGIPSGLDAPEGSRAARAREELSAYLASMATPGLGARREMVLLSRFLFDRRSWGYPYCDAAFVALAEIGKELGVPDIEPLSSRGSLMRGKASKILVAITDRSDEDVRAAAERAWERMYEAKLPTIGTVKAVENARWRH